MNRSYKGQGRAATIGVSLCVDATPLRTSAAACAAASIQIPETVLSPADAGAGRRWAKAWRRMIGRRCEVRPRGRPRKMALPDEMQQKQQALPI